MLRSIMAMKQLDDFQVLLIDDLEKHEFVPKDYFTENLSL